MMNNQNIYRQVCESIYGTEVTITLLEFLRSCKYSFCRSCALQLRRKMYLRWQQLETESL